MDIEKVAWLAYPGPNLVDFNWQDKKGTRVGIDRAAYIVPAVDAAIPSCVEAVHEFEKNLARKVLVFKKQSYVKYAFPNMSIWSEKQVPIRGSIVLVGIQLLAYHGAREIHLIDCYSDFDEWEAVKQIVTKYSVSLMWEDIHV